MTYKGVSGYIYHCSNLETKIDFDVKIPHAFVIDKPTKVNECEYISDAYEAMITAEKQRLIEIVDYNDFMSKKKNGLISVIKEQYKTSLNQPDYRFFLESKFSWIIDERGMQTKSWTLIT